MRIIAYGAFPHTPIVNVFPIMRHFVFPRLRHLLLPVLAVLLAACGSSEKAATPAHYADDAGVTARVRMALIQHPVWRDANLQVSTQSGVVRLTGTRPADQPRESLDAVVSGIEGVRAINNDTR